MKAADFESAASTNSATSGGRNGRATVENQPFTKLFDRINDVLGGWRGLKVDVCAYNVRTQTYQDARKSVVYST